MTILKIRFVAIYFLCHIRAENFMEIDWRKSKQQTSKDVKMNKNVHYD